MAVKYAQCMRANGVPNFPDPREDNGRVEMLIGSVVNPGSAQVQKAMQACRSLLPGGGPSAP